MRRLHPVLWNLAIAALVVAIAYGMSLQRSSPTMFDVTRFAPLYEVMRGIYAADHDIEAPASPRIPAVIVPHHITSTEAIAAGARVLSAQHPTTIVLLSPDHYHQCPTLLCTTTGTFRTVLGDITASDESVRQLSQSSLVTIDPTLFQAEHGIAAPLPSLVHYASGASIVPIVVSQRFTWLAQTGSLLSALRPLLQSPHTVLMVSSDFSHYLSLSEADRMDQQTMTALLSHDLNGIAQLKNPDQSDCPQCLWLLGALAGEGGFYNPSVLLHTNSARLLGDESAAQTTSHFAIAFYQNADLDSSDLTVGGDVTVTRSPARALSQAAASFWNGTGARLVNLEGPLSDSCVASENPYIFCNPLDRWRAIRSLATDWGVQNNHMLDQGVDGMGRTVGFIKADGESVLSDHLTDIGTFRAIAVTALLNPVEASDRVDVQASIDQALTIIHSAPPGKPILVFVHGGDEYVSLPSLAVRTMLHRFVDAGAAVVVQAHAHVPGDLELYHGHPIFSGLGNFVFDQAQSVATSTALLVRLRPAENGVLFSTRYVR